MRFLISSVIAIAVLTTTGLLATQSSTTTPAPAFEVASVKPHKPGDAGGSYGPRPGGAVVVRNYSLRTIIVNRWRLQNYQLVGAPAWVNTDRFDIDARSGDASAPWDRMLLMMRTSSG